MFIARPDFLVSRHLSCLNCSELSELSKLFESSKLFELSKLSEFV
jgi:hypothetical protein